MSEPSFLLLAAGTSQRFGGDKRQALFNKDRTVLQQTLTNISQVSANILIVLRANDTQLEAQLAAQGFNCLRSRNSQLGMGHSIADSIALIDQTSEVFICLADMPYIKSQTYALLSQTRQRLEVDDDTLIRPCFDNKPGHPVGFSHLHLGALKQLSGDAGAKNLIKSNALKVFNVEVNDPGVLTDIDRPTDLQ